MVSVVGVRAVRDVLFNQGQGATRQDESKRRQETNQRYGEKIKRKEKKKKKMSEAKAAAKPITKKVEPVLPVAAGEGEGEVEKTETNNEVKAKSSEPIPPPSSKVESEKEKEKEPLPPPTLFQKVTSLLKQAEVHWKSGEQLQSIECYDQSVCCIPSFAHLVLLVSICYGHCHEPFASDPFHFPRIFPNQQLWHQEYTDAAVCIFTFMFNVLFLQLELAEAANNVDLQAQILLGKGFALMQPALQKDQEEFKQQDALKRTELAINADAGLECLKKTLAIAEAAGRCVSFTRCRSVR